VRESESAAVFVLDPIALNGNSNIADIVASGPSIPSALAPFSLHPDAQTLPVHPVAIRCREGYAPAPEAFFTLHGASSEPLEEQCPACVRKVVLTEKEKKQAKEYLLATWMP